MGMAGNGNSSGGSRTRTTMSEINVTPLVDVMLVLLIIFMVTAPMLQQGLDVNVPETTSTGLAVKEEPFIIVVTKDRRVQIGKQDVDIRTLRVKLQAIFENRKDKQVYIQADKDVSYGFVAEAMAEVRAAGISGIGLVTMPKKD
jgi:biopolymer transport protein TolR